MLAKEWFDPEMPTKELLLGVYEWVCDTSCIDEMGMRLTRLQDESVKDSAGTLAYAMVYAFVTHENCAQVKWLKGSDHKCSKGCKNPECGIPITLDDLQRYGKEMYADYLIWIADSKQVLKDVEEIEVEDLLAEDSE